MNNTEQEALFRRELSFYFIKTNSCPIETAQNDKNFHKYSTWYITTTFDRIVTWDVLVYNAISEICINLGLESLLKEEYNSLSIPKMTANEKAIRIFEDMHGETYSFSNDKFYYAVPNRTDDWENLLADATRRIRTYYIDEFLTHTIND